MDTPNGEAENTPDPEDARAAVADVLARISDAWRNRKYELLADCFDEGIVMALPGFSGRVEGRQALIDSYRDFMERATISDYREHSPAVDVFGDSAVATYHWDMTWADETGTSRASGHDLFVFRRGGAAARRTGWRAVWRAMVFEQGPDA